LIKKNILICPLDWGLGHASRCVPVIKELQRLNFNIIIGADKNPLFFLQQEFPKIPTVTIPGYDITYSEKGSSFQLFCESVRFYKSIKKERQLIENIIEEHNIDIIISDNRYGLWSKKVKSIIITHQLFVKTPLGSSFAHKKIEKLINNFNECWIPDYENQSNLSGDLSHQKKIAIKHRFIGPLSRFVMQREVEYKYDVIAIISGPEPQRTIFENLILKQFEISNLKAVMVRGLPNSNINADEVKQSTNKSEVTSFETGSYKDGNIKIINHLPTEELQEFILKSKLVITRSGYSSIMDLVALGKKAILVPTPGQSEQVYLAKYHLAQGNFYTQNQNELDLKIGLLKVEKFAPKNNNQNKLKLDDLLNNN
jgi:uncharacterized protein (TIGR00661 family)